MIYKYLSIILAGLLVVAGGFYFFQSRSHKNQRASLNNQIAQLEGMVKESESVYSRRALEVHGLKSANQELQSKIEDRDEEIVTLAQTSLRWKDKYFEIKNATQKVIYLDGVVKEPDCLKNVRLRVDFDHEEDSLRIEGFTLTNPPEAELKFVWKRNINLSFILAKNKDNTFRLYLDTDSSDIFPVDIKLSVDPTILERHWYEKIGIGGDVAVGQGLVTSVKVMYDVQNWSLGPVMMLYYDGQDLSRMYGASVVYYPFR